MSYTEPSQVLDDKGADAAEADHRDFAFGQDLLAGCAEHPHLSVVFRERVGGRWGLRVKSFDALADDAVRAERSVASGRVARCRRLPHRLP